MQISVWKQILWVDTKKCNCWIIWSEYVYSCKKQPNCHASGRSRFASPPARHERSYCPASHQHWALSVFQILTILIGVQWYLTFVLACSPLRTCDAEWIFFLVRFVSTYLNGTKTQDICRMWFNFLLASSWEAGEYSSMGKLNLLGFHAVNLGPRVIFTIP